MSAPSTYTPEIGAKICHEISSGRALKQICEDEGMPHFVTVFRWLKVHQDFKENYETAHEIQAVYIFWKIYEKAEKAMEIVKTCEDPKLVNALVQALRVEIDTMKWAASKLLPKKYGDKLQLAGDAENPLSIALSDRLRAADKRMNEGDDAQS